LATHEAFALAIALTLQAVAAAAHTHFSTDRTSSGTVLMYVAAAETALQQNAGLSEFGVVEQKKRECGRASSSRTDDAAVPLVLRGRASS